MKDSTMPVFAVVGHPNKGKSSIVATLAQNDAVAISHRSRTTEKATRYTISTAQGSYDLIDTPGFQRPTKVLTWLKERCGDASQRLATLRQFIDDPECQQQFPDEVELLTPIVQGAAILYVVDGSRPYSKSYETEMEILLWTGQPSMALINPIQNSDFVDEWERALHQFFKSVTVFNPMLADHTKQIELLDVFAHLNSSWRNQLEKIANALQENFEQRKRNSVNLLCRLLTDVCTHEIEQKVLTEDQAKTIEPILQKRFTSDIKQRESLALQELLANYAHLNTEFSIQQLELPPDLFDCDHWYAWGLNKKQLVIAAAVAGAVSGAAVDLAVAGHSFMLGAIGGGLLGGSSAYFASDKIVNLKVKGLPLGGFTAHYGPIIHKNFPYVIIGRFLFCYQQISQLTHADRRSLSIHATDFQKSIEHLEKSQQKELHQVCAKLSKQRIPEALYTALMPLFD